MDGPSATPARRRLLAGVRLIDFSLPEGEEPIATEVPRPVPGDDPPTKTAVGVVVGRTAPLFLETLSPTDTGDAATAPSATTGGGDGVDFPAPLPPPVLRRTRPLLLPLPLPPATSLSTAATALFGVGLAPRLVRGVPLRLFAYWGGVVASSSPFWGSFSCSSGASFSVERAVASIEARKKNKKEIAGRYVINRIEPTERKAESSDATRFSLIK